MPDASVAGPDPLYHEGRAPFTGKPAAQSQLPTFEVLETYTTPVGVSPGRTMKVAEVQCQRKDCERIFVVVIKWWWNENQHAASPCPYCFKTGWRGKKP